ncbi:MAG: alpha/beta fold hydrolase [Anaerolineae bacterium]|nr:alpha/beta fold hydrolase [Anaerolineae bacterium]
MKGRGLSIWHTCLIALLLAACIPAAPTPEPTRTLVPEIAASPTVNPVLPSIDPFDQPGINQPEAAAAPNDMDVEGVTPLPSEAAVTILANRDGLRLQGMLFRAERDPAPAALLLHQVDGRREDWLPLVTPLQQAGFTVLAVDLRGYGRTGSVANWTTARQDVLDLLEYVRGLEGVDGGRIAVIGAGVGGNLALTTCVVNTYCGAVVMLSPGLDYEGVITEGAAAQLGERPLLLIAAEGDTYAARSARTLDELALGPHELVLFSGGARGTGLFSVQPGLPQTILAWLEANL